METRPIITGQEVRWT